MAKVQVWLRPDQVADLLRTLLRTDLDIISERRERERMSKWTPGPWSIELVKGSYQRPVLVRAGDKVIASFLGNQLDPDATSIREAKANACLSAAAPALYEALYRMMYGHADDDIRKQAFEALAKADGDAP